MTNERKPLVLVGRSIPDLELRIIAHCGRIPEDIVFVQDELGLNTPRAEFALLLHPVERIAEWREVAFGRREGLHALSSTELRLALVIALAGGRR